MSDLVSAIKSGKLALMSLLDMSATFDTVDHDILLKNLNCTYGIHGDALNYITSYLTWHTQSVKIDGFISGETLLSHGVPQGSVLDPILFILYTGELESIVSAHGLYADDNQIVFYCKPSEADNLKSAVVNCINYISAWMSSHHLKINLTKTEFIWLATSKETISLITVPFP